MSITDLNLVRAFVAIYETKSVSGAAKRLNVTQPSVSHALSRMRHVFNDPLFSRTRQGMIPTFNATQLFETFKLALGDIEQAIAATHRFEPEKSSRRFRIAMSDLGELHFLPKLVSTLQGQAPGVSLEVVQMNSERIAEWLTTGTIDLAIGNLPQLVRVAHKRRLFLETYSCLLNAAHPVITKSLSRKQYEQARHVDAASLSGHKATDDLILSQGITRTFGLRVPHFTHLSDVLGTSDLLLTLPTRVANYFARDPRLKVLELPFVIPAFEVNLYWQVHASDLSAQRWLCDSIVSALSEE